MIVSSDLTSSLSAYVTINPSGIIVNLIQLGTPMITLGYQQNLTLNPGLYSIDLDGYIFNASVSSKRIRNKFIHSLIFTGLEL
jgi:hypothetical protein